ncbi:MAG: glycosyltransferase [Oceanospirillaceae bacterium]|nr:glycosyltransferase [Oceanospirillaceae bacterium]
MTTLILRPGDPVIKPPVPPSQTDIMSSWEGSVDEPLVSIVCHTYNHEGFIKDALNSFLMQETSFPFEIIVHDDASTDNTQAIIKRYQSIYPKIVKPIYQRSNIYSKGQRPTMYTFPRSKGRYIALCEGDDFWSDKRKIQIQVKFLEENPEYSLCYTDSIPFQGNKAIDVDFGGATSDLSMEALQKGPSIYTLTACFKNILDNPPELALIKFGDKFFWSRLGKEGRGKYLGEILPSFYRVHSGGMASSASLEQRHLMYFQTFIAMAGYYSRTGDPELCSYFINQVKKEVYLADGISARMVSMAQMLSRLIRFSKALFKTLYR